MSPIEWTSILTKTKQSLLPFDPAMIKIGAETSQKKPLIICASSAWPREGIQGVCDIRNAGNNKVAVMHQFGKGIQGEQYTSHDQTGTGQGGSVCGGDTQRQEEREGISKKFPNAKGTSFLKKETTADEFTLTMSLRCGIARGLRACPTTKHV
ncbi:hypothetical protein BCR43DRAFT_342013 [Syncephalastrum racemosum]|uniref:Uncharacterized protein n=1 Tax=Syncephalastrum racemosum TaxID=13706 RepID=A0A1X2H907_SYNRA|nr:hypothetical protein BCR43DRAFT_342013 [Syncephalastrum racemosum]